MAWVDGIAGAGREPDADKRRDSVRNSVGREEEVDEPDEHTVSSILCMGPQAIGKDNPYSPEGIGGDVGAADGADRGIEVDSELPVE